MEQKFKKIETKAIMSDGRIIHNSKSFPEGVGIDIYRKMDDDLVKAFGPTSITRGTYFDS